MRILLVTPAFFPSLGGAAICFDTLSQELARLDPTGRVTVLTRTVRGAPRVERRGPVRVLRLLPAVGPGSGPTLLERLKAAVAGLIILVVSLVQRSDVVHYHTLASYRALHYLAPFFRAPLLADMRDLAALHEGASLRYYSRTRRLICASKNIVAFVRAGGVPDERIVHIPIPFEPLRSPTA